MHFPNHFPQYTLLSFYAPTLIPYYSICLFGNINVFFIEVPLLFPKYIEVNDLGNAFRL